MTLSRDLPLAGSEQTSFGRQTMQMLKLALQHDGTRSRLDRSSLSRIGCMADGGTPGLTGTLFSWLQSSSVPEASARLNYENMAVIDVSPRNDWTSLRFWNGAGYGKVYAAHGFIHNRTVAADTALQASR